jgi:hypothetical protein
MKVSTRSLLLAAACILPCTLRAQSSDNAPCTLDTPNLTASAPNIFNDQQEQYLGDALAELAESDMRIAEPAPNDLLTQIGGKLLATLPPTGIKYRFSIYDSGDINAFSLAGGRVYVSRKLIAAVKDEDALAGVVAHEMGHLSTHQVAIKMTYLLKVRLGVTQVGDRDDIFAKMHQLFSTPAKSNEVAEKEEKDQGVADHVAIYALVRAGYSAESFPAFLDQVMVNKGKTGSWLSDAFGLTHEDTKRYREALDLVKSLPRNCVGKQTSTNEAFFAWQRSIVNERIKYATESAAGDKPIHLDPPLRPSPWRIRFSLDGKYVLAQDEGSITVVDAIARKVLFRIDALDANGAMFTPDSSTVVFDDNNLRVERWSVATGQRIDTKEMVVYDGCTQSRLAPDGKTLVCLRAQFGEENLRVGLSLIDVDSGKSYLDKPNFYTASAMTSRGGLLETLANVIYGDDFASILIDPESHHLLISVADYSEAFDLQTRQQISLGGKLKGLWDSTMTFMGPDKFYLVERTSASKVPYKALVLSFPDGNVLNESSIGDQSVHGATKGDLILAGPFKDFATGIVDPATTKILAGWQLDVADVWDKYLAAETAAGGLFLGHLGTNDGEQLSLPLGPLPRPSAASFSPDGKYLAVSLRDRSDLWDLSTGKQVTVMRPMQSMWIDDQDRLYGILPKYLKHDPTEIEIELNSQNAKELGKPEPKDLQHEDLQFTFKSMGKNKDTSYHSTLEVKDMEKQTVLWSHDYSGMVPVSWPSDDRRMVLAWDLSVDTAKSEVKKYPKLQDETKGFNNHKSGLLVETVDAKTGAPLQQVALPEVDLTKGWSDSRFARVSGEYVLVKGEHSNTVIYRLDTGAKVGEFFGSAVASDAARGLIAAVNRDDEIILVDEKSGKEIQRFTLGSPVRLSRIMGGSDPKLLVLTADQVVHQLPLPQ